MYCRRLITTIRPTLRARTANVFFAKFAVNNLSTESMFFTDRDVDGQGGMPRSI